MSTTAFTTTTDIFGRVIDPQNPTFSLEAAKSVLELQFPSRDIPRMNELAEKANRDSLDEAEFEELSNYRLVGALLDLMHSKARISLKKSR